MEDPYRKHTITENSVTKIPRDGIIQRVFASKILCVCLFAGLIFGSCLLLLVFTSRSIWETFLEDTPTLPQLDINQKDNYTETLQPTSTESPDESNAEMLIAVPNGVPSQFLVPPPFPPPVSVLIRRKPNSVPLAMRRNFQDPRPFSYPRNSRLPVTSIQDILNQFEQESKDYERILTKKPKRINFYGRYKHRPNRPKVIPIRYGHEGTVHPAPPVPPMRNNNPSVANDVNHFIAQNLVPQRDPPQSYYHDTNPSDSPPQSSLTSSSLSPTHQQHGHGLYHQIIATNKYRHETAKDAKPFSLMLDIYPMADDNKTKPVTTTEPPLLSPPKLPPLQIDHSYYNSINFPQLNQPHVIPYDSSAGPPTSSSEQDQPEQMVVHLNLYPTKKKTTTLQQTADPVKFFSEQEEEDFMPILNPQIYYHSRSNEDEENRGAYRVPPFIEEPVVDIPRRDLHSNVAPSVLPPIFASARPPLRTGRPRVNMINFGPPINITDYQTTIAPQTINKLIYGDISPNFSTYLGQYNSNEIGRRIDDLPSVEINSEHDVRTYNSNTRDNGEVKLSKNLVLMMTPQQQHNSHQPDNPMKVENLSRYSRSAIDREEPSRKTIS